MCDRQQSLDATPSPTRALVISADVGGGHDANARGWIAQARIDDPHLDAETRNGLAAMGPRMHRFVRDGYACQLQHAPWSWTLLFRTFGSRWMAPLVWLLLPLAFRGRLAELVDQHDPDVIVSTYPLCTIVLASLRRSGRIRVPVIALVSDIAPHRLWFAPGVDEHLVATTQDVERAAALVPWAQVTHRAPSVGARFQPPKAARGASPERAHVLVSGGSWGAGQLTEIVERLDASGSQGRVTVLCGTNTALWNSLRARTWNSVELLAFRTDVDEWMRRADVLVATGPGMTIFEAMSSELPIVMAGLIPGHGRRSAAAAEADGVAVWARHLDDLTASIERAITAPSRVPMPDRAAEPTSNDRTRARRRPAAVVALAATVAMLTMFGVAPLHAFARGARDGAHRAHHPAQHVRHAPHVRADRMST
ncbi:MAG: putative UDP-glucuronosyltransferase [Thermoleophilia bacterium]|nr:putative UDP-glucuronosyltransferase [Thermoleophilia bacterium]